MAKTKTALGDVAQAMIEKRLRRTGKQGTYRVPGTDRTETGKAKAVAAVVEEAEKEDATATTRNVLETAQLAQRIHELADGGMIQKEIAEEIGLDITHVGDLLRWATSDPIIWVDEEDLTPKVVEARDKDKVSWAGVAIKAGTTIGRVQRLYREAGKDPHKSDIGKGGRRKDTYHSGPKSDGKSDGKKKPAAKKAPAKKAPAKKKTTTKKAPATKKGGAKKAPAKKGGAKSTSAKAKSEKATTSKAAAKEDEDTPF